MAGMRPGLRFQIWLILFGVVGLAFLLLAPVILTGLQQAAAGADPARLRALLFGFLLLDLLAVVGLGAVLLVRGVVRPLEALARRTDRLAELDFGQPPEGHQLGRLGSSFRRMVEALAQERARVQAQIAELEAANARLSQATESLVRSEKLATVGRLAAGVAHEIGNPLGGLIGYLELLRTRLDGDVRHAPLVDGALEAAGRIDGTIRELLDFSRPAEATRAPFDLREAVDDTLRLVRGDKRFAGVRAEVVAREALPPARGDRRRFQQVLVNLLLNAADAMEGQGEVRVHLEAGGDALRVTVTDTGPGVPDAAREEIFEPFYTTKDPGRGTGLGLAIARRVVEDWGGVLTLERHPEPGAAFRFTVPASDWN